MTLDPILMLIGFFIVGLAWYGLGQGLRIWGHGAKLDRIGAIVAKIQGGIASNVKSAFPNGRRQKNQRKNKAP